ncbi:hypothetical protein BJY52DRAFT_870083 [Lactarius psammicola]|nr:hypothetical protein BJY52DRAFT_870083 [Lactarius psammicola]
MSTNASETLPGLPAELLIRIFSLLQVADLLSVQHTCRRFCDVVSASASLQYFLRTEINLLEDILPPDISLHDRVALLKNHETAWNNLRLNEFTRFVTSEASQTRYILQDGYLIYKSVANTARYGYIDLHSSPALPNAEACWAHISLAAFRPLSDIVFAVDHNLAVVIRSGNDTMISFFEFTTGARHPLSLVDTVPLPISSCEHRKPEVEVLGDYILISVNGACSVLFVVSWKTGTTRRLYHTPGAQRVVVIDPDNSLIALIKDATNCLHISKLQLTHTDQSLHTLCSFRLPLFKSGNIISMFTISREWIPTLKPQDRTGSQTSRERPFPFQSYRTGTIVLTLNYSTQNKGICQYAMFVSVGALLSVAHSHSRSGVRHVPWDDWGPAGTRILPLGDGILPRPAGPFWITSYAPLVVRDYDSLRARYIKEKKKSASSIPSIPSLGPPSTKLFGGHWVEGKVETHLPFREFVAGNLPVKHGTQVVADREWVVVVSPTVRCPMLLLSGEKQIICADREEGKEVLLPCTMWVRLRPRRMFSAAGVDCSCVLCFFRL